MHTAQPIEYTTANLTLYFTRGAAHDLSSFDTNSSDGRSPPLGRFIRRPRKLRARYCGTDQCSQPERFTPKPKSEPRRPKPENFGAGHRRESGELQSGAGLGA